MVLIMSTLNAYIESRLNKRPPRIIVRSFWGFNPTEASLIGFTLEGNRKWFVENYDEGDLVLIYGADGGYAKPPDIGRALGFIQVEKKPINSITRMSPKRLQWEKEQNLLDRWTYGLPIKKAWVCLPPLYEIRKLAAYTFSTTEGRIRGSRGVILTDDEAREVLKLKCRQENVYLEPPVCEGIELESGPLYSLFSPSNALPPSGAITVHDGPRKIYLSEFKGPPSLLLPSHPESILHGRRLVKVGLAKNPDERFRSLNQGFPQAARELGFEWSAGLQSISTYPNYEAAVVIEDRLKAEFHTASDGVAKSLGGEFFLVKRDAAEAIFMRITMDSDRVIKASTPFRRKR